jgi:hypothetical protein
MCRTRKVTDRSNSERIGDLKRFRWHEQPFAQHLPTAPLTGAGPVGRQLPSRGAARIGRAAEAKSYPQNERYAKLVAIREKIARKAPSPESFEAQGR